MKGTGFDAGTATANSIKFNGEHCESYIRWTSKTTRTSLVVSFTHLSPSDKGALLASVTVDTTFISANSVNTYSDSLIVVSDSERNRI